MPYSPRETSLSVNRYRSEAEKNEAGFFELLEAEVSLVSLFGIMPSDVRN